MARRQGDELIAPTVEKCIGADDNGVDMLLDEAGEGPIDIAFAARMQDWELELSRYADICRMRINLINAKGSPSPGWVRLGTQLLIKSHGVNASVPTATSNRRRAIYPVCHSMWLETRPYREERALCEQKLLVKFLARSISGFRSTNVLVATRLRVDPSSFACVARAKMQPYVHP
jgi:hypothetical protein